MWRLQIDILSTASLVGGRMVLLTATGVAGQPCGEKSEPHTTSEINSEPYVFLQRLSVQVNGIALLEESIDLSLCN